MNVDQETQSPGREVLAGLVERVTFHNAENGFCIIRVKARGHRDLVTMVGHAAIISAGEWITASGERVNDRSHGQQFKTRFMRTSAPTSIDGIETYLGSGMVRGIGPVYAQKLVKAFGEEVFDVIEAEPARLREVAGIGPVRAKRIYDRPGSEIVRQVGPSGSCTSPRPFPTVRSRSGISQARQLEPSLNPLRSPLIVTPYRR